MGRATLTTLLLVLAIGACASPNQTSPASTAADSLALVQLRERFSAAVNSADIEGLVATVDNSLVAMPPDGGELLGPEGLRSGLGPSFEQFRWDATYPSVELNVAGDWAFERGTYQLALVPREGDDPPIRTEGNRLWIFRRQADGSWRISHIMFSQRVVP
jgi:ketosteroid isomerase-like protein